ncbi:MAG: CopD family protein [Chromatocurvus sp.]
MREQRESHLPGNWRQGIHNMPWLLVLHISAVLLWSASLLYLPALIVGGKSGRIAFEQRSTLALGRTLFTRVATLAAMLAIVSGTVIFVISHITSQWLVLKLSLVSGLVICHALLGWMMLRTAKAHSKNTVVACVSIAAASMLFIVAIIIVVLMKPY